MGLGASNVRVSNLRFLAAADSIARAVDIDSGFTGIKIDNCNWDFNATTNDFRVMLRVGSPRSVVEDNRFIAEDTAGAGRAISLKGGASAYSTIRGNYIYGQFDTVGDTTNGAAAIAQDTTDTADTNFSGLLIENNKIISTDTAVTTLIRFSAGYKVRGLATNNQMASYDTAAADSDHIAFNGLLGLNNFLITADSDVRQSIIDGNQAARLELDS